MYLRSTLELRGLNELYCDVVSKEDICSCAEAEERFQHSIVWFPQCSEVQSSVLEITEVPSHVLVLVDAHSLSQQDKLGF